MVLSVCYPQSAFSSVSTIQRLCHPWLTLCLWQSTSTWWSSGYLRAHFADIDLGLNFMSTAVWYWSLKSYNLLSSVETLQRFLNYIPLPLSFQLAIHPSSSWASIPLAALKQGFDTLPLFSTLLLACHSYWSLISLQNTASCLTHRPYPPSLSTQRFWCAKRSDFTAAFDIIIYLFSASLSESTQPCPWCLLPYLSLCPSHTGSGVMGFCRKRILMEPWPSLHYICKDTHTQTHIGISVFVRAFVDIVLPLASSL